MTVRVLHPKISVALKKNIGRANVAGEIAASTRFTGTNRIIDLTPYLGDSGSVVTRKSVREPAGMFSVTLADNFAPGEPESLYGVIEPMDVVEIRMAHDTSKYAGAFPRHMPIIMRGFVTDIERDELMHDGQPQRTVTISGQDYGKILDLSQIAYLPNQIIGELLLTNFKFFVNYGVASDPDQDAATFVTEVIDGVVNPLLANMRSAAEANGVAQGISPILDLKVDAKVSGGIVSPFGVNAWPGGRIADLLTFYGDVGPWNELFVEDREDGPYLVYRPTPYKDATEKFIQEPYVSDRQQQPAVATVTDRDLVSLKTARSDRNVANYVWVDNPSYSMIQASILQNEVLNSSPANSFLLADVPNSSPVLYGLRQLKLETRQGPRFDGKKEVEYDEKRATALEFVNAKRAVVVANNRDNVVFESGTMKLAGNEALKAGSIVRLVRGDGGFTAEYYAHTVQHEFAPFRSFTTTVTFDRGTGFINRAQRENGIDSPYLAEMRAAGAYG
jgi:hypothetical protein